MKYFKCLMLFMTVLLLTVSFTGCEPDEPLVEKPVIYLYPQIRQQVSVELKLNGELTSVYPEYSDGWNVIAEPDGTLVDPISGREYYCLYWEGISNAEYDLSKGFVIAGEDTAEFLEDSLAKLGLTEKEANEFIIYWLPRMEGNNYNLISSIPGYHCRLVRKEFLFDKSMALFNRKKLTIISKRAFICFMLV